MKKPLHKHIGNHARRIHRNVTKYLYERDTIFATLWVFVFIVVLGLIPINFYFLNPLKLALKDFDFNDMAYAKLKKGSDSQINTNVVIINIDTADRQGLAELVEKTGAMKPKVMALDVLFDGPRDPYKDSLMREAVAHNPNLVLATHFVPGKHTESEFTPSYFSNPKSPEGFVNFLTEEWATVRLWNPFIEDKPKDGGEPKSYSSFVSSIIKVYDPALFEKMEKKVHHKEIINYTRKANQYLIMERQDIINGMVDTSAIRDKIVLLGFINLDRANIEDKKFTPMNEKFAGKSIPDMNGIVVHANIISMVLENNYIKKLPLWFTWLVAILIGWLHMSFFIRYYLENHIWFHLVAKIAQLASAIFFVYLGIYLYDRYRIKLDMKMTLIVIVMAVDVIYFYEAWASWMHKKYNYRTVFKPHHH